VNVSKGQLISDLDARLQISGVMVAADLGETTAPHGRRSLLVAIDRLSIAFDRVDDARHGARAFVGDRRVERREIDWPHRLSAEHEGIVAQAFTINLRLKRELAQTVEADLRFVRDTGQPGRQKIAVGLRRSFRIVAEPADQSAEDDRVVANP